MEQPEDMASLSEFDSLAGSIPATKVEITVSCRNLLDKDMFSKSDPYWCQYLPCHIYDVDSKSPDLSKHDFLGQAFCTLGEIVGSSGSRLEKPLTIGAFSLNSRTGKPMPAVSNGGVPGKKCGSIILSAEELSNCRDVATMQFCANKLDKKDFFGKSDPFLVFYRSNEDGTFTICHKTEVMKNTLNPVWQTFSIPVRALCNGDYDRTIKVEVYDWDRDGSHDFIGEFTTSYRELARGQSQFNIYEVINPKKKMKKKKYVNSGTVTLLSFAVESESTFLDYIKGGTQINFTVAIDFTASNGNPSQSTSLHYMSPYQLNAYALALTAVGEIIQHYDSDKMFPALGFGAKLPPDGRVSHEFPLNGNQENPSCCGIDGILEAYHSSLRTVQLYGPTNFAPVVTHVARNAATVQDGSQYSVLLIITDGVISDMAQTKEAIVNAAKLPMSIIIVGVGQAEFDAMVELDGDDVRISSRGKLAERDIVQFVPFRDYVDRTGNHVLSMARLARDVLAEIPDQLVSYMKAQGIRPRPPPAAPPQSPPQSPTHSPPGSPLHTHI
ncbi:copine-9-like protein [Cricetulus griseus]|nr:copine-9-like protein [Cricetulus griseus]